jgi:hypothetical protein
MGQVVSLSQHQATKQMQIREAERKAQDALLQASAAFKELHRLKGDWGVRQVSVWHPPNDTISHK